MVVEIQYSPAALRDLEQIGDYIAVELNNPSAALHTLDKIQDGIDKLVEFPKMGAPLSARYEDVGDYRYLVSGNYLTFYREDAENVYIDRVLYGKRDYVNLLFSGVLEEESIAQDLIYSQRERMAGYEGLTGDEVADKLDALITEVDDGTQKDTR